MKRFVPSLALAMVLCAATGCSKDEAVPDAVTWAEFVPTYPPPPDKPPTSFLYLLLRTEQKLLQEESKRELDPEDRDRIGRQVAAEVAAQAQAGAYVEMPDRMTPEFVTVLAEVLAFHGEPFHCVLGSPDRLRVSSKLAASEERLCHITGDAEDLMRERRIKDRLSFTPSRMVLDILTSDDVPLEDRKLVMQWFASVFEPSDERPTSPRTGAMPRN